MATPTTTAFFIPETAYYAAPGSSSIQVTSTYIETTHDAIDGFDATSEQVNNFIEFFINNVSALVNAVEDSGSGSNFPARDPDKIALLYTFNKVNPNDRETWLLRLRWGQIDNYKKEFYWKRIMRLVENQERDGDMPQMLRRDGYGLWHWYNQPTGTSPSARFPIMRPFMGVINTSQAWTSTTSLLTTVFHGPTGVSGFTEQQLKDMFNNFIMYKTNARIKPVDLPYITYSGFTAGPPAVINVIFDLATTNDPNRGVIVKEIIDHCINGFYSIYSRLLFEIVSDADAVGFGPLYDTVAVSNQWFAPSTPFDTVYYQD